jgi:sugar phosphate isomerase/epimerase
VSVVSSQARALVGPDASEGGPHILFSTGALYVCPLHVALELAQSAGCDGVELDVCLQTLLRGPAAVARVAEDTGMPIRAIHPPLLPLPGWHREDEAVRRIVGLALDLQIPTIVLHPPKVECLDSRHLAAFLAQIEHAQARLQGTGIRIVFENPGFFRPVDHRRPLWDLRALHRLATECELGMALDTTHAGSSAYPLLEAYAIVADRLAHVHLSDLATPPRWLDRPWLHSYVKHHQIPGAGRLPLAAFLQGLARDGFQGDVALELSPLSLQIWRPDRARRHLATAVATTRRLLASE